MPGVKVIQPKNRRVDLDDHDAYLKSHHEVIYYYRDYISTIYGVEAWEALIDNEYFDTLYYSTVYKYGIAVFHDLVDITSDILDISVCNILTSFGQYMRK